MKEVLKIAAVLFVLAVFSTLLGCAGADGQNGVDGAAGAAGPKGDVGAVGPTGPVGPVGPKGDIGLPGATGPAGQNGAPGSTVTAVQFCPDQGSTTYGHFPEQGLCIGSALYGVYWDGTNAFLAQIVPGRYVSTSTGLACNFTVSANCVVSR